MKNAPLSAVPLWHPLLRTTSLLSIGRPQGEALMAISDALAQTAAIHPPEAVVQLAAQDLWQFRKDLEIFEERAECPLWAPLRSAREGLTEVARAMGYCGGGEGERSRTNPVRTLAKLQIPGSSYEALRTVADIVEEYFMEVTLISAVIDDPAYGSALGVHSDLEDLAAVLAQQVPRAEGILRGQLAEWARTLQEQREAITPVVEKMYDGIGLEREEYLCFAELEEA